jgi:ubiquinone/menaquinone biosynthesis C-methylase UbiE
MTWRIQRRILPGLRWNQEIYGEILAGHIGKDTNWLDVGCGHRVLPASLEPLEDRLISQADHVTGCDVDEEAFRRHRSIRDVRLGSANSLPFADQSFGLVTANMVCEHLSEPESAFREVARVLQGGGEFIVHTPNLWNYLVFSNHVLSRIVPRKLLLAIVSRAESRAVEDIYPTYYRANTAGRLSWLATQAGMDVKSVKMLTAPQPFFKFFAPVAAVQLLLMKMTLSKRFCRFAETIVMVFERPSIGSLASKEERTLARGISAHDQPARTGVLELRQDDRQS